ncbi:MAG: hypothetical protein V4733_03740 [Verrucomicrobiota bacterium]
MEVTRSKSWDLESISHFTGGNLNFHITDVGQSAYQFDHTSVGTAPMWCALITYVFEELAREEYEPEGQTCAQEIDEVSTESGTYSFQDGSDPPEVDHYNSSRHEYYTGTQPNCTHHVDESGEGHSESIIGWEEWVYTSDHGTFSRTETTRIAIVQDRSRTANYTGEIEGDVPSHHEGTETSNASNEENTTVTITLTEPKTKADFWTMINSVAAWNGSEEWVEASEYLQQLEVYRSFSWPAYDEVPPEEDDDAPRGSAEILENFAQYRWKFDTCNVSAMRVEWDEVFYPYEYITWYLAAQHNPANPELWPPPPADLPVRTPKAYDYSGPITSCVDSLPVYAYSPWSIITRVPAEKNGTVRIKSVRFEMYPGIWDGDFFEPVPISEAAHLDQIDSPYDAG